MTHVSDDWDEKTIISKISGATGRATSANMEVGVLDEVQRWINKLDLRIAMTSGKLGVQQHHATVKEGKFRSSGNDMDANRLKAHLKLFALADSLHSSKIGSLDDMEIRAAVEKLQEVTTIPNKVRRDLVKRRCDVLMGQPSREAATALVQAVLPWPEVGADGKKAEFDCFEPKLGAIDVKLQLRIAQFVDIFCKRAMPKVLLQGEASSAMVLHTTELLKEATQKRLVAAGGLSDQEATMLCEIQGFACGVWWLVTSHRRLADDGELRPRLGAD